MELIALVAAVATGLAVLLLILGVFEPSRNVAAERLEQFVIAPNTPAAPRPQEKKASLRQVVARSSLVTVPTRLVERRSWSDQLARDLARADLTLKPFEYLVVQILVVLGLIGLFWILGRTVLPVLGNSLFLIPAALLGIFLPRFYVKRRQQKRLNAFNDDLADTITLLANALRAGSSFLQATELVVRESKPPVSTEFARVIREVQLGLPSEQALANMVRRVRSPDLELMATAITIQNQVGGNLAEILDTIAFTIRERVRIKGEIRVLTSQQRLSGYVVGFLPIALLVVVSILAPQFMQAMFEKPPEIWDIPLGVVLLGIGGVLMLIGFFLIRRIVDIEV
jgi:tight adherence protein B